VVWLNEATLRHSPTPRTAALSGPEVPSSNLGAPTECPCGLVGGRRACPSPAPSPLPSPQPFDAPTDGLADTAACYSRSTNGGCGKGSSSRQRRHMIDATDEFARGAAMPKISKESLEEQDFGSSLVREGEVGDYTVDFISFNETEDWAPMLAGLPDGRCQCPHWGVVLKGRQTWRFADREEVFEAGDAFYVEPGHVPVFDAGSETILFSPTAELKATDEAIRQYMESNA
jgi:hypothetical protein